MAIEHTFRVAGEEFTKVLTKARAIRHHCMDCCCGQKAEVARCSTPTCPLYPFRFGNEKGLLPERNEHLNLPKEEENNTPMKKKRRRKITKTP